MQSSQKLRRLGWLLLIWLAGVGTMAGAAAALKFAMRLAGLAGAV